MFDALLAVSIVGSIVRALKEENESQIPSENWANTDLYLKDAANGVPVEQRMKGLKDGKYKMENNHPEPHRDPVSGKIVIENTRLYYEDAMKYGAYTAQQWVKQGKYNLTPEELRKENLRIKHKYKI